MWTCPLAAGDWNETKRCTLAAASGRAICDAAGNRTCGVLWSRSSRYGRDAKWHLFRPLRNQANSPERLMGKRASGKFVKTIQCTTTKRKANRSRSILI